jgi:hypothetical protein
VGLSGSRPACQRFTSSVVKPTKEHHPQVTWVFNVIRKIGINRSKIQSVISRDKYEKDAPEYRGAANRKVLVTDILQRGSHRHDGERFRCASTSIGI